MGSILQTSNTQHTSLLVAEQLPDFVRDDHPVFVTFIEKYYEFMANNTVLSTANSDVYYCVAIFSRCFPLSPIFLVGVTLG